MSRLRDRLRGDRPEPTSAPGGDAPPLSPERSAPSGADLCECGGPTKPTPAYVLVSSSSSGRVCLDCGAITLGR